MGPSRCSVGWPTIWAPTCCAISDVLRDRDGLSRSAARERAIEMLDRVGIVDPEQRADAYPFQLSGGMRQRVMIAAAVVCGPRVLLCDEPTTALDVTIQASIISLFKELQREEGISLLYVTHDLAVVAELCSSLTVLYAGQIMEQGDLAAVFAEPASPYTAALLDSTPVVDGPVERLLAIPGSAPTFAERTSGCPFAPRCAFARESCRSASMTLHPARAGLKTACIRVDEHASVIRDATAGAVL